MAKAPAKHKKRSTAPYDVAEHLRTPEEMAAYLDAWLRWHLKTRPALLERWVILRERRVWHRLRKMPV